MWTLTDLLTRIVDAIQPVLQVAQHLSLLVNHLLKSLNLCGEGVIFLLSFVFRKFEP